MKNLISAVLAAVALLGVAGCVAAPEGVAPSYVDPAAYSGRTCGELRTLRNERTIEVAALSKQQSSSRARGIAYNLLLIPGAGALAKDRESELGRAKGELLAIEDALTTACQTK